jgi:hypothetical protein
MPRGAYPTCRKVDRRQRFGAGLPTPPMARPKVSLNSCKALVWETIGRIQCGVGRPAHNKLAVLD